MQRAAVIEHISVRQFHIVLTPGVNTIYCRTLRVLFRRPVAARFVPPISLHYVQLMWRLKPYGGESLSRRHTLAATTILGGLTPWVNPTQELCAAFYCRRHPVGGKMLRISPLCGVPPTVWRRRKRRGRDSPPPPIYGQHDTLCRADLRSALLPIYVGGGLSRQWRLYT